jgi:hypothetical protein
MWHELESKGQMSERKICPIMSDSRGRVLCQGRNCYAAYPQVLMTETLWFCRIIDGPGPTLKAKNTSPSQVLGEHEQ